MCVIGGSLGYRILRLISPGGTRTGCHAGNPYAEVSKLDVLFRPDFWNDMAGNTVVDFGCGYGGEAIEIATRGASRTIGIDIRHNMLEEAGRRADQAGVADRCTFTSDRNVKADVVVSVDAFEHFDDPGEVLETMAGILGPNGVVWVAFGPPWYHPHGGHLFSVFPWAHLVFTESALIRWRSDFKTDGAKRFGEVEGGLNQMTIHHFKKIVGTSPFRFDRLECVPIRRLRYCSNVITREFLTSFIRCRLVLR